MFRRSAILELGGYDARFPRVQDYELWLRISEKYKIASCPKKLCQIRFHRKSLAHSAGTQEQFKYTLLGYVLHERKMKQHEEIPASEWEDYFKLYEKWYYAKIAPSLTNVWRPRMEMISSIHRGQLLRSVFWAVQILKQVIKRALRPKIKQIISNIPAVSEFMSQKLESITLHGIVKERWDNRP